MGNHTKKIHTVPELLAPAGSVEALKAVISAGADAVYIGGARFGARAYADNPDEDALLEAIDYAHLRGVRVHLTVNTLLKDSELDGLYDYMLPYYQRGVDAVLVQDFGVLAALRRFFPDLTLHASTQMTVTGAESAELLKKYGVARVVPARELSIEELSRIHEKTGIEVETFIHGALCCCYSGQCLYSSMLGGRSGNRGRCAQPCRLLYLLDNQDFDGSASIVERKDARHYLSPKDLCAIDLIDEFYQHGIASLKIEGRMKKPEYAAGVVSIYRKYLDRLAREGSAGRADEADRQMLYDLYNRSGFTDGYFRRWNGPEMMAPVKHELTDDETRARHELYERMRERYIDREKKIPLVIRAGVYVGEPVSSEFSAAGHACAVSAAPAEKARNMALGKERIAEQLGKVGDTDFELSEITVDTDENSFLPVRELNELRRTGISKLRESILEVFKRNAQNPPDSKKESCGKSVTDTSDSEIKTGAESVLPSEKLIFSALVSETDQLKAVLLSPVVRAVYLESSLIIRNGDPFKSAENLIRSVRSSGKEAFIALPYIDRAGNPAEVLKERAEDLANAGLSGFLARNIDTAAYFINRGLARFVTADAGIYTFNREAVGFLRKEGILRNTAPVELNRKELFGRDNSGSEIIVYGYLPLMVTVQCLDKNTERCERRNRRFTLTDRMGMKFPVKCDCVFCYNIVRNSLPLMLLSETGTIRRMGFPRARLQFTDESREETARILKIAEDAAAGRKPVSNGAWTKGHFLRGVE